ncbi:MAG: glycoside hydrolase family 2 protein [Armatimonadota bacterium]
MKTQYDLSQLNWRLTGWTPYIWRLTQTMEIGETPSSEVLAVPAKVPGSVQEALRAAGEIADWNVGTNWLGSEWVENRDWIYEAVLPKEWFESGKTYRLNCLGLDYKGSIVLNGKIIEKFCGSYSPYSFDLTPHLAEETNVLQIIFEGSPRWLGQAGFTSEIVEWKPRFYYTWDWCIRLMQIGIWDSIYIEATDRQEIADFKCVTGAVSSASTGSLRIEGRALASDGANVTVTLAKDGKVIKEETLSASQFTSVGVAWNGISVELWWPNMFGEQPLYDVSCVMTGADGRAIDCIRRRVGFKELTWVQNEDAPKGADPWICVVNGKPTFLQGVNWVPILPNFAEVTEADYWKRITLYKDLGLNIFRVWGGAVLEKEIFYNLCDEAGILVWQEFPLSSSGIDNYPPTDLKAIDEMAAIAKTYIDRRQHHVSLAAWCGGNELINPNWVPVDDSHPMLARLKSVVEANDPTRRFLPTSPSGPSFSADPAKYGEGRHWDVHGPWKLSGDMASWAKEWEGDDALFRSETGCPGTSSVEIIMKRAGTLDPLPVSMKNPLWRLPTAWWIEGDKFEADMGYQPATIDEYVEWSQKRQAEALSIAVKTCKDRFPRCGGVIIWMGHDCYPCLANTSIVDVNGEPKPAALALAKIFREWK